MTSPSHGRSAITRGVNAHRLSAEGRLAHRNASLAERPSFPSVESTRAYLDALMCPFCPLGPFKYPLSHISFVHGISAPETRAYLGVPRCTSFSDPNTFLANKEKGAGAPNLNEEARRKRGAQQSEKARKAREAFFSDWRSSDLSESTLRSLMERHGRKHYATTLRHLRRAGEPLPIVGSN